MHCRVSSSKQSQTGESLDIQEKVCFDIATSRGWNIEPDGKIFRESFSGRKSSRPIFEEIIEYIKQNPGKIRYYLFRAIDRFTRGGSYTYETMKRELSRYGVEMIDSYGIIQPSKNTLEDMGFEYEWSKYSPSEITELVLANTAKGEVTNILTRTIGQEIRLTQQGFKVRSAHDGFKNKQILVEGKKKIIQVPDPERSKYFVEMFTLRAQGTLSDQEIVDRVNAMGYRSKTRNRWDTNHERIISTHGGIPLSVKHLQEIIPRPIYCGVMCEKWTKYQPIKARYDGLVSIDVFNKANRSKVFIKENQDVLEILYNYHPERIMVTKTRDNPLFPYKQVIMCPFCKKPFMGSSPVGKSGKPFPTYHCSRKSHKYYGVPKDVFETAVENYVKNIKFSPEYMNAMEALVLDKYHTREKEILQTSVEMHRTIADLKAEQATKVKAFVDSNSSVVKSILEKEIDELEQHIKQANTESAKIDITESDIKQFIKEAKYVMEHLEELLLKPVNTTSQRSLFSLVFEELPTYADIVAGTPKLSLVFRLSEYFKAEKNTESRLGSLSGFEPELKVPQTLVLTITP